MQPLTKSRRENAMRHTAQHTPGPWSYNRDEGGYHGHVISTGDYIVCDLPDAGDGAAPHTEANARLIAAAPELLEAAQLAAKLCALITAWADAEREAAFDIMDEIVGLAGDNDDPRNIIAKVTKA
jgi:hypothetical protein